MTIHVNRTTPIAAVAIPAVAHGGHGAEHGEPTANDPQKEVNEP